MIWAGFTFLLSNRWTLFIPMPKEYNYAQTLRFQTVKYESR